MQHGLSKTIEYKTWKSMKYRCYGMNNKQYKDYGGRGIKVCDRWLNDFPAFLEDMGKRPSRSHSLDRINTNKDYSPDNCRWATHRMQANNTRRTNTIMVDGRKMTLMEIARRTRIHPETLRNRIKKGWDYENIIRDPKVYKRNGLV